MKDIERYIDMKCPICGCDFKISTSHVLGGRCPQLLCNGVFSPGMNEYGNIKLMWHQESNEESKFNYKWKNGC